MGAPARKLEVVKQVNHAWRTNKTQKSFPESKSAAIRKIADVLLREHPEGLRVYTLIKIAKLKLGCNLETSYVVTSLFGHNFYIDCKQSLIFKP